MANDKITGNMIYCRDCGEPMKNYPYSNIAFGCGKCKLKATIEYKKQPRVYAL